MKLVSGLQVRELCGDWVAVPSGPAAKRLNGLIGLNATSAFLIAALQAETDEEAVLRQMLEKYDAPEAELRADLAEFLDQMRELRLLEE